MKLKNLIVPAALIWAGSSLYMAEKYFPLSEKRKTDKPVLLCLGDSITFGAGVKPTRKKDCWVYILKERLKDEYEVLNYGISGSTLLKQGDMPYMPFFYKRALKQNPEVFILMLGTNDSKPQNWNREEYERQLKEFIDELKKLPSLKKLYLCVPPWAYPLKEGEEIAFRIVNDVIEKQIRPYILDHEEEFGVSVIDLYEETVNRKEYFDDGVHPNIEGNHHIADVIYDRIRKDIEDGK